MDEKLLKQIIKELSTSSNKLSYEERFDVASLKNNIFNSKITLKVDYLVEFLDSYPGQKLVNNYNYLKANMPTSYIAQNYNSVEELKDGLVNSVNEIYIINQEQKHNKKWIDKHLKPVIAYEKINLITMWRKENRNKETFKMVLLGNQERKGVLPATLIYTLLVLFGFVFLYPILYMVAYSYMSTADLVNSNVTYVPTGLEWNNYFEAWKVLNYPKVFFQTMLVSILPAICQTIVCAITGWGLARFTFKGKKLLIGLIIFTFIVPSCLTMLPTVALYAKFKITGTVLAYILPALFGQGFKSAVFILIFYQYFKAIPNTIIEAAEIDGANTFTVFLKIGIPSALSGILLTVLLSVVWYYNETVLASVFFGSTITTLPLGIENFKASFDAIYQGTGEGKSINEAIYMAGTILNILPLVVLYAFTQKYFIQGMDKAGITGE